MTQWFNPPFRLGPETTNKNIFNSFGVSVASAVDRDTARGIASALNLLHQLGFDPDRDVIGTFKGGLHDHP